MTRSPGKLAAVLLGAAAVVAPAVPVLAQTHHAARPAVVSHHKRVQADNFRFCSYTASACTTSDSNHTTRVKVDTRVKWIYKDTACDAITACPGHDVKFAHRGTTTTTKTDGAVIFSTVFHHTGTFSYWCTVHKTAGMTGRIVVTN